MKWRLNTLLQRGIQSFHLKLSLLFLIVCFGRIPAIRRCHRPRKNCRWFFEGFFALSIEYICISRCGWKILRFGKNILNCWDKNVWWRFWQLSNWFLFWLSNFYFLYLHYQRSLFLRYLFCHNNFRQNFLFFFFHNGLFHLQRFFFLWFYFLESIWFLFIFLLFFIFLVFILFLIFPLIFLIIIFILILNLHYILLFKIFLLFRHPSLVPNK